MVNGVLAKLQSAIAKEEKEQAIQMYTELIRFFGKALHVLEEEVPDILLVWSKKNAAMQVVASRKISEIAVRYLPTRIVFNDILTRLSIEYGLSTQETALLIKRVDTMLDVSLNETIFAFERLSEEREKETQQELLKLLAPIVPIKDDVVILPLIGDINLDRTTYIMNHVVPKISGRGVNYVIADFSGVLKINQQNAELIHQIGGTLRLMGIQVLSAGLRPGLIQTAVNSNIDLSKVRSFATVKQALESIK